MKTTQSLPSFGTWLAGLKDKNTRALIAQRIRRLEVGLGDVKPLGDSVSELRIDHGPGWRIYFTEVGGKIVLLVGGGDKSTQSADIAAAKAVVAEIKKKASEAKKAK